MKFYERHAPGHRQHDRPLPDTSEFRGFKAQDAEAEIPTTEWEAQVGFANLKEGTGVDEIVEFIAREGLLAPTAKRLAGT
jgi:hypothetical protein